MSLIPRSARHRPHEAPFSGIWRGITGGLFNLQRLALVYDMSERPPPIRPAADHVTGQASLTTVIRYTALVGLAGHFLFILLFLWLNVPQMAVVNVASCAIFAVCFWLNRRGLAHAALLLGAFEVVAHAGLSVAVVGWAAGFHYYILGLTPLVFYSPRWRAPTKIALVAILCGLYIALFAYSQSAVPWVAVDVGRLRAAAILNILTLFVVLAALAYYYRLAATNAELALTHANEILERQAYTDPLTRLSNRREMQASLLLALDAFRLRHVPFAVVLGDVDDFKELNDRYGHEAGDNVLVAMAGLMRADLRQHDLVVRWGGEEFLMLLHGTQLDRACRVAQRLRERIATTPILIGDERVSLTMTLGVAEYAGEPDPAVCIKRADDAMYLGKRQGKNQVVVSNGVAGAGARPALGR